MRYFFIFILTLCMGCSEQRTLTSSQILKKSIQKQDPNNTLRDLKFKLRVQEPRLQIPERFSIVTLDNKTGEFELQRNRDSSISRHIIDKNGTAKTLLDNSTITDSSLIKKYRLEPQRNFSYRRFYRSFSLLPMSLQKEEYVLSEAVENVEFNDIPAYKISLELGEPMFSKNWNLFFAIADFTFLGLEIVYPEDASKGERVYFDGNFKMDGLSFARYHHWHELNGEYLGSDIFVSGIE